ncbi:MAG: glucose-6-phosphate dehydrogenase [Rhodothermales bacterium]
MPDVPAQPTALVIFGAAGDLAWRKLVPALYDLAHDGHLPQPFHLIGLDKKSLSDEAFRKHLKEGVDQFARHKDSEPDTWKSFAQSLSFLEADFGDEGAYEALAEHLTGLAEDGRPPQVIFYLATPPTLVGMIAEGLKASGLSALPARIVIEKPFGRDLESARELNATLTGLFDESQIYRIDHYLGKETVQNILAFRFANALFEPIWDCHYIDHVQISVTETVGVGHRAGYYEHAGALRDMVQNHLLQLLCLIAMEPPVSFEADEIRNKKSDVLRAVRPIPKEQVFEVTARGQYGSGWIEGERAPAYRSEPDVRPESSTETFAALQLYIDNWRWQGVPFYLRTGKRLPRRDSEIVVQLRPVPQAPFRPHRRVTWEPNRIIIHIQPDQGIVFQIDAKQPGPGMHLRPVNLKFAYEEAFGDGVTPDAYETLLLDVMEGDATLFMRADQEEAAWAILMPVLEAWESTPPFDFPNYDAGSQGPDAAVALLAESGRRWLPLSSIGDRPGVPGEASD